MMKLTGPVCGTAMALALAVVPNGVRAGGIPVIDTAGIAQMITEYTEMLTQSGLMNDQIANQIDQITQGVEMIEQGQEQIDAITGTRELSGILDGLSGIHDLLPTSSIGGDTSAASMRLDEMMMLDELRGGVPLWGDATDPTSLRAVAYEDARSKSYMEGASAEILIEGMPEIEAAYSTLIAAIDDTEDVKGSMDLAARIAAENGRSIARLTHMMAITAQARSSEARALYADEEATGAYTSDAYDEMAKRMTGVEDEE